jgi:type IV pilus assembly protein PilB
MQKSFGGRQIDFWVSILPGHNGEKVVLRILDPKAVSLDLEELVINKDTRELIKNLLSRSTGLLLTTGPEVSGISTTLAALLTQRNQLGVNIATVEDPIERTLPGINQVEVSEDMGRDYDSVLHSFLNQNIDVIGVDQIRGRKTAKAIVSAALNHLVLTSFSAPDAASAIVRLTKLGVDVASLANNLIGIINQRLVRRLCPACRLSYEPTAPELEKLGLSSLAKSKISCYRAKVLTPQEIEKYRSKGRLCRQCNGTGYQGQIGIYEVMGISQRIKTLIGQEEEVQTIYQAAIEEGMQSLLAYGVELVLEGKTTFAELEQVLEDYVHLQSTGAQQPYQGGVSPQLLSRVQAMEKLLNQLNQEFKQLKKEIELAINEPYEGDNVEVYEELKQSREWQEIKQELDLNRDTIVSNVPVYEELIDPGEWEELQKELDPDKETIVSQDEDLLNLELDPSFRPLSDPWS